MQKKSLLKNNKHIKQVSSVTKAVTTYARGAKAKKVFAAFFIALFTLLLISGVAVGVLHLKNVQTFIIGKVTEKLEDILQADVRIAQFHYRPLSHLAIDSIYISDQQHDTLAFINQMQVEFHPLQLRHNKIDIQSLRLNKPYINLQSTSDTTLNVQFLIDAFKSDSIDFPFRLNIDTLSIEQTRFRYNDLIVDQLTLDLALPVLSNDSLDVQLHSLHLRAQIDQLDASFEADLHGGLDSIFAENMYLKFRNTPLFAGNIAVFNPTDLEMMYIEANCSDLYCNDVLVQDLLSQLEIRSINIPKEIKKMGDIHYRGEIHGRIESLNLDGVFKTSLGSVLVNGDLKSDTTLQNFDFIGHVSTKAFHLGKMFDLPDLGTIALHADMDGKIVSKQLVYCKAKSDIQRIEYKGYDYQHIHIDGELMPEEVKGQLSIHDENLSLNINGLAEWSQEDTRLNINMKFSDFKPATLHLIDTYPDLKLGATVFVDMYTSGIGKEILDNMTSHMSIDSLLVQNGNHQTTMKEFTLDIYNEYNNGEKVQQLLVKSDYLTASLSGPFQYSTLPSTIQKMLHQHLPSLVELPNSIYISDNSLEFYTYFHGLDSIMEVLELDIKLPSYQIIKGYIREDKELFAVQAFIPNINTDGSRMQDLTISLDNQDNQLGLSAAVINHLPKDNPTAAKLGAIKANIHLNAKNDEIDLLVNLDNTDSIRNAGQIHANAKLSKYNNKPKFDIQILPSNIILNDSSWDISQANIMYTIADNVMDINNFALNTKYQFITVDGRASELSSDSLKIALQNINLDYLLSYTEASKVISIMGPVTGNAHLYSMFSEPMLEAQAQIPNGGLNGVYLGDVTAEAVLDRENKSILIYGQITDSCSHIVANIEGKVVPENKWWGLDITCDSVDIHFIDAWTNEIISNPQGRAYGKVKIEGQKHDVWVTGRALAKDAQVTIPQIGATLYISDSIYLDSTLIRFPNITIYDEFGNQGTFNGILQHENFLDIKYDLTATANNMMLMDLPATQQSLFYGKVFGSGDVRIQGDELDCHIDVKGKTEANTKFYLNINSASQASNANFINFVQRDTSSHYLLDLLQSQKKEKQITQLESRMKLSMEIEATQDAEIAIKMGGEDGIKGSGEGVLKLVYEYPSENIQMQGTYTLLSGKFDFSLGNIVRRGFTIRDGSQITWDGDPLSPMVNMSGFYHTTASLRDLFGSESSQIATDRTSVPVNCVLSMTDQLFNPNIEFAIELPQSDESVQSQVNSMINTDEMLMRQVIYLLVFNRFYTPDYLQNTQNVGLNETYSLLSSTITGQINSWLSKLTDVFTMGFNFRTDGEGETASQEYEANFQIHPINQLIINGNFGYRYNDLSNRPFFGDLDVEYLLTENGKLRAKAFTHTVDKYSLRQANMVQGVGFVFKHNFNWGDIKSTLRDTSKKTRKIKKKQKEK